MKRTPMVRTGGLKRATPLRQTGQQPGRVPLVRSGRVNPVSAKRVREQRTRAVVERQLGKVGGVGECAMCGSYGVVHGHELDPAGYGKDYAHPDVLLDDRCNGLIEDMPISAAWHGWKHSTKHPRDPKLPDGAARRADGSIHFFAQEATP